MGISRGPPGILQGFFYSAQKKTGWRSSHGGRADVASREALPTQRERDRKKRRGINLARCNQPRLFFWNYIVDFAVLALHSEIRMKSPFGASEAKKKISTFFPSHVEFELPRDQWILESLFFPKSRLQKSRMTSSSINSNIQKQNGIEIENGKKLEIPKIFPMSHIYLLSCQGD